MPHLTQSSYPRLWLLMQQLIGGNASKQAMAIAHFQGQKKILEVGCSVGNISSVFLRFPGIQFTGIDIDESALAYANRRFAGHDNFHFRHTSLEALSETGEVFDYVLFAGMLHHVDDERAGQLLSASLECLSGDGRIVIYEPERPRPDDNPLLHFFCRHFEQGAFLRSRAELEGLAVSNGIVLSSVADWMVSPGVVKRPYVARFNVLVGRPSSR